MGLSRNRNGGAWIESELCSVYSTIYCIYRVCRFPWLRNNNYSSRVVFLHLEAAPSLTLYQISAAQRRQDRRQIHLANANAREKWCGSRIMFKQRSESLAYKAACLHTKINEGSWKGYEPQLNICLKRKSIQCDVYLYYRHKSCASYCYCYCNLHIRLNRSLWLSFVKIKQTKRVSEVFCKKPPFKT